MRRQHHISNGGECDRHVEIPGLRKIHVARQAAAGGSQARDLPKGVWIIRRENIDQHLHAAGERALKQFSLGDRLVVFGKRVTNRIGNCLHRARFVQIAKHGAVIYRCDGGFTIGIAGQHDPDRQGIAGHDLFQEFDAAHAGHLLIGDYDGERAFL